MSGKDSKDDSSAATSLAAARLAAIVDSSYDAIIGKDLNSIITDWNRAAERVFGYTAEEAVGKSILMLIPDGLQGEEAEIIGRVRRGEMVASYETTRRRKDGTFISVSLTVSPIKDSTGRIIGASKIARDISAAKESEHRIRLLMREVNHRVKNQFAVVLSVIRETSRRSKDPAEFEQQVRDRVMALSRSHDLLVSSEWAGASLLDLLQEHLKPFGHDGQVTLSGPLVTLQPTAVQHLGMAFHELGSNSAKFGAFSSNIGSISIEWHVATTDDGRHLFQVVWDEKYPQAHLAGTSTAGFGSVVLRRVAPQALNGSAALEHHAGHIRWALEAPAESALVCPLNERIMMAQQGDAVASEAQTVVPSRPN